MSRRQPRSYRQYCGVAQALDVLGERWTLLVVRELLLGVRRYSDLLASLPGLTTNLLAARLKAMEGAGLIAPVDGGYQLTSVGASLEPVVMELGRFGGRFLKTPGPGDRLDLGWLLLSLKRRYVGGVEARLALHVAEAWYTLAFEPSWLRVVRGRPQRGAATLHGEPPAFRALLVEGAAFDELFASARLSVDGDPAVVRRALRALLPAEAAHLPPTSQNQTRWSPQTEWVY